MKKILSLLTLLLFSVSIFAQSGKIDYDKKSNIVSDAGKPLFKMVPKRNANTTLMEYSIRSTDDKELFFISSAEYNDPASREAANPSGREIYLIFNFLDMKLTAETRDFASKKNIAQYIVDSRLVKDGALDQDGVKRFVQLTGNKFSDRQSVINQPGNTTIIQQSTPAPKNNINININTPH